MSNETIKFNINEGSGRATVIARYIESNVEDVMPDDYGNIELFDENTNIKNIFLLGSPASGKSMYANYLAKAKDFSIYDGLLSTREHTPSEFASSSEKENLIFDHCGGSDKALEDDAISAARSSNKNTIVIGIYPETLLPDEAIYVLDRNKGVKIFDSVEEYLTWREEMLGMHGVRFILNPDN